MKYLAVVVFVFGTMACYGQDAYAIVEKAQDHLKGETAQGEMTIEIIRPTWSREMSMKTWSKGEDYSMILITAPAKEKGIVFLKRKKEVWNWIPSIDRNVKLPPSMMSQSWMGTDFTNDDLVQESSMVNNYEHKYLKDSVIDGRTCWKIEMTPKEDAAVVWGKVLVWIDQEDYLQLRTEFYDEDNYLVNTMIASDIKDLGGKTLPAKMELIPADKDGHKTIMTYQSLVFDEEIDDDFFTTNNMKRVK